jgi:titin
VQYSSNEGATWATFTDSVAVGVTAAVTGLQNGTSYVFRVAAVNAAGQGAWSLASSPVTPFRLPGAPTLVSGSGTGPTAALVTWLAPADTGGFAITDYRIQYSANAGTNWSSVADSVSSLAQLLVSGLSVENSYIFRVAAVTTIGQGAWSQSSAVVSLFDVPTAPLAPTATATGADGTLSFTWSAPLSDGGNVITDYVVQYSANSGLTWSQFSDAVGTSTSATITGLQNGTSYVLRTAALNNAGQGAWSVSSSAATPYAAPSAPTALTGTSQDAQVALTWAAPAANGAAITDYVIQYSADSGSSWIGFSDAASATNSAVVAGLQNGTSYVLRVAAVNAAGQGAWSLASAPVTPATAPIAPLGVTGAASNAQVALSWWAPTSDGGAAITDYVIQFSANAGSTWSTFADGSSSTTAATITGLQNGTSYVFRVAAVNTAGTSIWSEISATITPFTTASAPVALVGATGNAQVALGWSAPLSNGGAAITDYVLQYSSNGGASWNDFTDATSTALTATVTGLTNGTQYVFRAAAMNAAGLGAWSATSAPLTPAAAPDAPGSLAATASNAQVALTWATPAANGAAITDYVVEYSANSGTTWLPHLDGASTTTSAAVTGLTNGTQYVFRVAAVNAAGTGAWSSSAPVTPATVPGVPTGISGTFGYEQVALAWSAPLSNGGASITDYVVQYSSDNGTSWVAFADAVASAPSATVTGLSNAGTYVFRVAAVNAAGQGAWSLSSAPISFASAPSAPTISSASSTTSSASFSWSAPADNGSPITSYTVSCVSANGGTTRTSTGAATTQTVSSLDPGKNYSCSVTAQNAVGTSSASAAKVLTAAYVNGYYYCSAGHTLSGSTCTYYVSNVVWVTSGYWYELWDGTYNFWDGVAYCFNGGYPVDMDYNFAVLCRRGWVDTSHFEDHSYYTSYNAAYSPGYWNGWSLS